MNEWKRNCVDILIIIIAEIWSLSVSFQSHIYLNIIKVTVGECVDEIAIAIKGIPAIDRKFNIKRSESNDLVWFWSGERSFKEIQS
jgi:hypothetical protein